jgi:tetratricopeptide (TPR) repeat protein
LKAHRIMSAETDKDLTRTKRYTRLALVSAFVLAFLWPLGSFFFWVCLGTTTYFAFLAYYYSPRPKKFTHTTNKSKPSQEEPSPKNSYGKWAKPLDGDPKKKIQLTIFAISGIFIFIVILIGILSPADSEVPATEDTSVTDETADRLALQNDPNDVNALTNVGNRFYSIQQYDSALYYYERVLTLDSRNTACLHNKALVLYQKNDFAQSLVWAKKCLSIDSEYIDAILLIGDGYYIQENYSTAITWYQQAYAKGAHHSELLSVMAFIYDKQNNQGEAIRFYKETLQQDSSYVEAYTRLAVLESSRKEWYRMKAEQWK